MPIYLKKETKANKNAGFLLTFHISDEYYIFLRHVYPYISQMRRSNGLPRRLLSSHLYAVCIPCFL